MVKWFRCLSEVPGVGYKSHPSIDRSRLPGHNVVPSTSSYVIANERHEYLSWPTITASPSASPAKLWKTQPRNGESLAQTCLRQLYETLELPAELSDYHFAIQNCCLELWSLRREEPWVLVEIEELCWLNIRLLQAHPDFAVVDNEQGFLLILAFGRLISLYEQEGYLHEALQVAEVAVMFNQQVPALERLRAKIANLEAEEVNEDGYV
jgi:hypothetical protein